VPVLKRPLLGGSGWSPSKRGNASDTPTALLIVNARPYRWSVEVSAYVRPDRHRLGVGRTLYLRLFDELAQKGFCHAYAGITLPNDASVALHRRVGFEPIGIFKSVGRKFAKWHDVAWFQRTLRDSPPPD